MHSTPLHLFVFATLMSLYPMCPTVAKGCDRCSMITIINQTPYRVDYTYSWGADGAEDGAFIQPYETRWHAWTFAYPNQNYAPFFYVQPDGDNGWYKLRSFYSPDTDSAHGRVYYIRWDRTNERFYVVGKLYTN
jgi:hypothetical protein